MWKIEDKRLGARQQNLEHQAKDQNEWQFLSVAFGISRSFSPPYIENLAFSTRPALIIRFDRKNLPLKIAFVYYLKVYKLPLNRLFVLKFWLSVLNQHNKT